MPNDEIKLVDTKRVGEIIAQMEQFTKEMENYIEKIQNSIRVLGTSYRDEQYDNLNKSIQIMNNNLSRFIESQNHMTPLLREKLEDINAYQRIV